MPFTTVKVVVMLFTPIVKKEISAQYESHNAVVRSDQNFDTTDDIDISLHELNKYKNCATPQLKFIDKAINPCMV